MKAETNFVFFPDNNTPNMVRAAVAIYWIAFSVFFYRIVFGGVGIPPFRTRPEVEAAITLFGLLSIVLIFYAFIILRISAGKLWARNVALFFTAFTIVTILHRLFAQGFSSESDDVVSLMNAAAETVAGLLLLTPGSTRWFKSKIR